MKWKINKLLSTVPCALLLLVPVTSLARDIALNTGDALIYTANHDSQSISRISMLSLTKLNEFALGMRPDNLALDGLGRFWVTFRAHDRVGVFTEHNGAQVAMIPTGDEPFDVLSVSESMLAVTLFKASRVLLINNTTFEIAQSLDTLPHPRGLALSADGLVLYVTHFFSGTVSVIDIASFQLEYTVQPEADGNLLQNIAVTDDDTRLYLPLTRSNVTNNALLFDTTVFPVVSVIDPEGEVALPGERISLDIVDDPVGIPIDAAVTDDYLFILNAASNDLTVINRETELSEAHLELGHNPRSMMLSPDKSQLFIHNSLSGSISVVDTESLSISDEIQVSQIPLPASLLNGKRLFNSSDRTDLSKDQWISCATCHFDGETDLRTWFFPDGPRNTPSLLGSNATGPYHWSGDLDELHDVEATIRNIQAGTGLAEGPHNCDPECDQGPPNAGRSQDLDDLAAFMAALTLPPNPNLEPTGYFSAAAIRGAQLFHAVATGCGSCHIPPLFTDHLRHDIGTGGDSDERKGPDFDTPSLRGIFSTAPYLHDGRAATIKEVLTTHNSADQHGSTSTLTQDEIDDLVAFLQSLTFEPPVFRSGFE